MILSDTTRNEVPSSALILMTRDPDDSFLALLSKNRDRLFFVCLAGLYSYFSYVSSNRETLPGPPIN